MKIYGIFHCNADDYYDNGSFFYYFLSKEKAEAFLEEVSTPPPIPENWMEIYEAEKSEQAEKMKAGLLCRQEEARKQLEATAKGRETLRKKLASLTASDAVKLNAVKQLASFGNRADEKNNAILAEKIEDIKFWFPDQTQWLNCKFAPKHQRQHLSIEEIDVIE